MPRRGGEPVEFGGQPVRDRRVLPRRPVRTCATLRPLDGPFKRDPLACEVNAGNTPTSQEPGA